MASVRFFIDRDLLTVPQVEADITTYLNTSGIINRLIQVDNSAPDGYIWNPNIQDLQNRLDFFGRFWYNRLKDKLKVILTGGYDHIIDITDLLPLDSSVFNPDRDIILNRFLNDVKSRLNAEQGWNLQ